MANERLGVKAGVDAIGSSDSVSNLKRGEREMRGTAWPTIKPSFERQTAGEGEGYPNLHAYWDWVVQNNYREVGG